MIYLVKIITGKYFTYIEAERDLKCLHLILMYQTYYASWFIGIILFIFYLKFFFYHTPFNEFGSAQI